MLTPSVVPSSMIVPIPTLSLIDAAPEFIIFDNTTSNVSVGSVNMLSMIETEIDCVAPFILPAGNVTVPLVAV